MRIYQGQGLLILFKEPSLEKQPLVRKELFFSQIGVPVAYGWGSQDLRSKTIAVRGSEQTLRVA